MIGLNEFMKRRSEIEAEYARSLQRLIKPYKDDVAKKGFDRKSEKYNKATTERFGTATHFGK
jgi:hypothetical protein